MTATLVIDRIIRASISVYDTNDVYEKEVRLLMDADITQNALRAFTISIASENAEGLPDSHALLVIKEKNYSEIMNQNNWEEESYEEFAKNVNDFFELPDLVVNIEYVDKDARVMFAGSSEKLLHLVLKNYFLKDIMLDVVIPIIEERELQS